MSRGARPWQAPGTPRPRFHSTPAAPGRRGGSINSFCKRRKKRQIYIYVYIYVYISSYLHPSPQIYVAAPYGSKVRAKGTTWCIPLVEGAKLCQIGLKMG